MKKEVILKVERVSKQYRLGVLGTGSIVHDLNRWWAIVRGKEDPYLKIGETNDRSKKATSEYVWALKDINFEVKRGEVLGIIGKNGAGKSTLLKILSKVTGPSTGSIKSRGRIASLLEVGTGFHPEMTGRENIYLNGAILGMTRKEIKAKLDEIIEFSGCERYIDTPTKRYSSGMTVRLAFAVAAFLEPDILIVDEVLAVGDAEFQKKAIGKMKDISEGEGRTVLFVSHDMAAIQSLCTELLVLGNGTSVYQGKVIDGIDFYLKDKESNDNNDLLSINSRSGNGSSKFKSISFSYVFKDKLIENVENVMSGSTKLLINLEIENYKQTTIREIDLSIDISDNRNIPVSNVSNEFTKNKIILEGKTSRIVYEVYNLNLRAMTYSLSLFGREKGGGVFDFLENQIELNVIESDFYGTGSIPRGKQHGYLLIKNKCYNT